MSNWISFSPSSGHGNGQITITADTLSSLVDRVGSIIVFNTGYSLTAITTVTQKGVPTAITFSNVVWVYDVPASGGTATDDNCTYVVYAQYADGSQEDITADVTISGSLSVSPTTSTTRNQVGTLELEATYDTLSCTTTVNVYQAAPVFTEINIENLTWVTDIASSGGTATSANCSFNVYAYYDAVNYVDVTNAATVSGSANVPSSTATTRHTAGTLTLTATYSGFTDSSSTTIYQSEYVHVLDYLKLIILTGGTVGLVSTYAGNNCDYEYKINDGNWVAASTSASTSAVTVSAGDIVYYRGDNNAYGSWTRSQGVIDYHGGCGFRTYNGAVVNVEGNLMSMIDSVNFETLYDFSTEPDSYGTLKGDAAFYGFFANCDVVSSSGLTMQATGLTKYCYSGMFNNRSKMVNTPTLPATTVNEGSYYQMFNKCTSLANTPELVATTIGNNGYGGMFSGCTSLTSAATISATTAGDNAFGYMFDGCSALVSGANLYVLTAGLTACREMFRRCTSMTKSPTINIGSIGDYGFDGMFGKCTALIDASDITTSSVSDRMCFYMFSGCTSLLYVPSLLSDNTTLAEGCYMGMFKSCTSLTTVPALPSTTLAKLCYNSMFSDCSGLITAPDLPATTLPEQAYQEMFYGCRNLNSIKCLATTIGYNATSNWVASVQTQSGTFTKNPNMSSWSTGNSGIPSNWTVVDAT